MDKLKIFVSGKEGELSDERKSVLKVIEEMGFDAESSENRPASEKTPKDLYIPEVQKSDIYIGIFGKIHSLPSIEEFVTAGKTQRTRLIFVKEIEKRDEELQKFLDRISKQLWYRTFYGLEDLERKVKNSIVSEITEKYRNSMNGIPKVNQTNIQIKKWIFPEKIIKGMPFKVSAKVSGSIKNGFLDFMIKESESRRFWFPDPQSYNEYKAKGKLELNNASYENEWNAQIPRSVISGIYTAYIGIYEDVETQTTENRRLLDYEERDIEIE